jgi:Xaa-Pro aminopeptidase
MANRLDRVRPVLDEHDAGAVLLTAMPNIRWACGFTGSNALLIVRSGGADFVTDGRYDAQANQEVDGAEVHVTRGGLRSYVAEEDLIGEAGRVVVQADDLTVAAFDKWRDQAPDVEWVPVRHLLVEPVARKDEGEIDRIRRALAVTETVYDRVVETIEPGQTEREVAAEIVYQHLKLGAEEMSFDPIVASGPNAALPHARPTDRTIEAGDLIVIDMGGVVEGYASDTTRTVAVGPPSDEARRGYEAVRRAQEKAVAAAEAGMTGKELDAVARSVLEDAGLGDHFAHSLGHGVGLQVHEWPRVSHTSDEPLPTGACVTIEPGVYVPDEGYGVRIEDMIVLRDGGCDNLSTLSKDLHVLDV